MTAAAALAFAMKGRRERKPLPSAGGAVLAALGTLGIVIPIYLHPRTPYMTSLVQVEHNLDPRNQLVLVHDMIADGDKVVRRVGAAR